MKKSKIIEVVLEHLRADFERRHAAARRTREQGNDAESKSEGKYDTRSTEENYLAEVVWNKKTIVVLTPESPLGAQLIGRRAGERVGGAKIKQVL